MSCIFSYKGFSYAFIKENPEITVNDTWPGLKGPPKTNTILQYDEDYEEVITWGAKALPFELTRKAKNNNKKLNLVELFKLHLGDVPEREKPELPTEVPPERAITDYLREMGD